MRFGNWNEKELALDHAFIYCGLNLILRYFKGMRKSYSLEVSSQTNMSIDISFRLSDTSQCLTCFAHGNSLPDSQRSRAQRASSVAKGTSRRSREAMVVLGGRQGVTLVFRKSVAGWHQTQIYRKS